MARPLRRIVALTHLVTEATDAALAQLAAAAPRLSLELLMPDAEAAKHPHAGEQGYRVVDDAGARAGAPQRTQRTSTLPR